MRSSLNTTTALIASLSLLAPSPVLAQEAAPETPTDVPLMCPDGSDLPCAEGVTPVPAVDDATVTEEPAAEEVAPEAESTETAPETTVDDPAAEAAEEPAAEEAPAATADEQPATEEAPAATAEEPPVTEEAPAEAAEEPPATEEVPAEAAEEPPVTDEAPAEAAEEPPATDEAPAEAAEEQPATDEAPAEAAEEQPATGSEPAEPVLAPDEAPAETTADPAEDQPEAEAADTPPAGQETDATGETAPAEATGGTEATGADLPGATDLEQALEGAAEDAAGAVPDLPVQPDAASGEAPVAAAAEAPADAAEAEVTEEVVTEDTARSSDEDFATELSQAASAAAPARDDDDDGLSDAEKIALVGLGALAVGALLSNNRRVALNSGDRVVVTRDDGSYQIIKDDSALLRQPGSTVRTETFQDGSTRTTVLRPDGSQIVTIRDAEYRVLRRAHVAPDGTQTVLIDDTEAVEPVVIERLPPPASQPILSADADEAALRAALAREAEFDRRFSLAQVRDIAEVRALVPVIDLTAITFETGSAAIRPDQAQSLSRLGNLIGSYIDEDPREMFLIEGHTDAVGSAAYNLALSDRRAESVALALTEYFAVPPENLVVQGYGEEFLRVDTQEAERQNRRASVRRITDLLRQAAN